MSDTIDNNEQRNNQTIGALNEAIEANEDIARSQVITDYIDDESLKIVEAFEETQAENLSEPKEKTLLLEKDVIKAKKSVTFNPNDEKIRKFTTGEPIVDQKNPFKNGHVGGKDKKTPPPVPTKRSTLSVRKTVTQQLRERERERKGTRKRREA